MWNGGVTNIGGRGRGGSVDRGGRSRNGRGSLYSSHYSRAVGFEDSGEVIRIDSGQSFQVCNIFLKQIFIKSEIELVLLNLQLYILYCFILLGKKSTI